MAIYWYVQATGEASSTMRTFKLSEEHRTNSAVNPSVKPGQVTK
jgi:hypothetical protein